MENTKEKVENRLTEGQQIEHLARYYNDAYAMVNSTKFDDLGDDQKENIAFAALEAAVKTFDPSKGVKFTTYLFKLVKNRLLDAMEKITTAARNHKAFSLRVNPINEEGEDTDIESIFGLQEIQGVESDPILAATIQEVVTTMLTPRQVQILEILMNPEKARYDYYEKNCLNDVPNRLSDNIMSDLVGVSRITIFHDMKKVREIFATALTRAGISKENYV